MRVLVTGASGFVGGHVLAALHAKGYEVHAVSSHGVQPCAPVQWHQSDLLDQRQCREVVAAIRPTHLLHFAWYAVPQQYWTSAENLRWVGASLELAQAFAAAGGRRVVMAGTCAEYAWGFDEVCSEQRTPLKPATLYGACKSGLQQMLAHWSRESGVSAAWGRIFSLYGPREHPSRLVPSVITALLRGEEVTCRNGDVVRDYLHVADVAGAFVTLLNSDVQGPVNVASGIGVPLRDLVAMIGSKVGAPHLLRIGVRPASSAEPACLVGDIERLRETGWRPRFDLDRGLDDTISWWREQAVAS